MYARFFLPLISLSRMFASPLVAKGSTYLSSQVSRASYTSLAPSCVFVIAQQDYLYGRYKTTLRRCFAGYTHNISSSGNRVPSRQSRDEDSRPAGAGRNCATPRIKHLCCALMRLAVRPAKRRPVDDSTRRGAHSDKAILAALSLAKIGRNGTTPR